MSNKAYVYDPITREFVGVARLDRDPLGGGFLLPANATYTRPELMDGKAAIYDSKSDKWTQITDLRGVEVYAIDGGNPYIVEQLGDLPDSVTTTKPEPPAGKLTDRFKVDSGEWLYRDDYTGVVVYNTSNGGAVTLTATDKTIPDGYTTKPRPSEAYNWDATKQDWVLNAAKQEELDTQAAQVAGQARLAEIENAIQTHINQTVANLGMGFTDDTSLIGKYAGYDNVFRPIAEAVGKWVAGIWYKAAQDKNAIIAGKKPIPTVEEAVARIPKFVMPEQSTEVQNA